MIVAEDRLDPYLISPHLHRNTSLIPPNPKPAAIPTKSASRAQTVLCTFVKSESWIDLAASVNESISPWEVSGFIAAGVSSKYFLEDDDDDDSDLSWCCCWELPFGATF